MEEERVVLPTDEERPLVVADGREVDLTELLLPVVVPLEEERVVDDEPDRTLEDERFVDDEPDRTLEAASPLRLLPARPVTDCPRPADAFSPRKLEALFRPTLVRPLELLPA